MLEIKNISFKYERSDWLFKHLNFTIEQGEIVGMYGKSGSGKTTLAKIITNYVSPIEGDVIIDGEKGEFQGIYPVQLIWQHPEKVVNPKWKLIEVIEEVEGLDKEIINILGIKKEWFNRRPSELSGGELQRFCIARAFSPNTRYIVADEITSMFDAITQAQIWHAMMKLVKQRNIGLLAISHHIHLLEKISDRIIDFNNICNVR
ncbi:MAG: ATP-binding cassette domain-containing protein [Lysinibacillus sp.]|nr:ATP-binding cassette domain-containing protein [Lysinibacillus sp.]